MMLTQKDCSEGGLEKIHIDVEAMLLRTLAHFVQSSFDHFNDGRNLYARVGA